MRGFAGFAQADTVTFVTRNTCKAYYSNWYVFNKQVHWQTERTQQSLIPETKTPFLRIHGHVQYDFIYRSFIDTPFSQHDFQQHTVQTFLSITVKDKYPINLNLSKRISNSPYFRNFMDVNMRYDKNAFIHTEKQQLLNRITNKYWKRPDLSAAEEALQQAVDKYNNLKAALEGPDVLQQIIEEREKEYHQQQAAATRVSEIKWNLPDKQRFYKMLGEKQGSKGDSLRTDNSYTKAIEKRKKELDSLQQKIGMLQTKRDSVRNKIENNLTGIRRKIYQARNTAELQQIGKENDSAYKKNSGLEKFLANVKSVGIGRSVINYSELTAWNVALTGFNIEYNDGLYAALAAGKIDYGFRDFLGKNTRQKGQNFLMGRIGMGDIDHKAIIISAFTGKKYTYGSVVNDSVNDHINIAGYAIEGILNKNEHTGISIEVAKTTKPITGSLGSNKGMPALFQFSDNTNLGISAKGHTLLPKTNTDIAGFYRKTGAQFQSFSLFTYNTNQTAWQLRVEQPFLNNKIGVIASLRRNDFTNPISEKTFKTSTVFKSIQVNVRVPRWPSFSAGYYPGSQLYIIDKERIRENAYYIVNASVMHHYAAGNIRMLSSLLYNRYSGKGTDSGFITYSGSSYMASQTFILSRVQLQAMYMYTDQEQMQYYTLDANGDYSISGSIRIGGGVKYNKVTGGKTYPGGNVHVNVDVKQFGGLQLQYEKVYLPTIWKTLYPVETGRISWLKYF